MNRYTIFIDALCIPLSERCVLMIHDIHRDAKVANIYIWYSKEKSDRLIARRIFHRVNMTVSRER